jgi:hypothetical protein
MNDPLVEEVRRIRGEHAARSHYDLWAIFRDFQEQQKRSGLTFVSFADGPDEAAPRLELLPAGFANPIAPIARWREAAPASEQGERGHSS